MNESIFELLERLYPICRSITGNGVINTLNIINEHIPINIKNIPSGTKVFDWVVPLEWNIKNAYIKDSSGTTLVDFSNHNLHIVSYSTPISQQISYSELASHIHTIPEQPNCIPYRTSYYKSNWGFCMKHNDFVKMEKNDIYTVNIDSCLKKGNLTYADIVIPGNSKKEILLSCYTCHPSMCNDSISGVVVATYIAKYLLNLNGKQYYTYRILFIPETIGSITYISQNIEHLKKHVVGGYVITCVGNQGEFTYLKTRHGNSLIDKITLYVLEHRNIPYKIRDFVYSGSDERQYNYPGVDLNIGSLMKKKYHEYPEYHTSADDLKFVSEKGLTESLNVYIECINVLEMNHSYKSSTICEPQLGKYGLYNNLGGECDKYNNNKIDGHLISKFLKYCDGDYDLIDISKKLNITLKISNIIISKLIKFNLII